jgi:hypothetical protein
MTSVPSYSDLMAALAETTPLLQDLSSRMMREWAASAVAGGEARKRALGEWRAVEAVLDRALLLIAEAGRRTALAGVAAEAHRLGLE